MIIPRNLSICPHCFPLSPFLLTFSVHHISPHFTSLFFILLISPHCLLFLLLLIPTICTAGLSPPPPHPDFAPHHLLFSSSCSSQQNYAPPKVLSLSDSSISLSFVSHQDVRNGKHDKNTMKT